MIGTHCGRRLTPAHGLTENMRTGERWHTWKCGACQRVFTQRIRLPKKKG